MTPVVFTVDLQVHTMESICRTAYRFSGRAFIRLRKTEAGLKVGLEPKLSTEDASVLAKEFENDLLDQRLRSIVAAETSGIRDLILAHALSQSVLVRPEWENPREPARS
ncbi:MAG: His-Xaa-Ser system protein HxsD [Opitutae bacterium]|nr:His-Xaa-Ser system protein HxsD [Opitutae bacterium]